MLAADPVFAAPEGRFPAALRRLDPALDCWCRPPASALQPLLRHYAAEERPADGLLGGAVLSGRDGLPKDLLPAVPKRLAPWRGALMRDLARALAFYREHALDLAEVRVRLEIERRDRCRLFHTDRIGLRLLSTYLGPGTEWVPEIALDRAALGSGDNSKIAPRPEEVRHLHPFWVGLFKGDLHPDCRGRGSVHRSPPIERRRGVRILLTIDDPWQD
jgi:hypothetical protein